MKGIGTASYLHHILLYGTKGSEKSRTLSVMLSSDALRFYFYDDSGVIALPNGALEDMARSDDLRLSKRGDEYIASYTLSSDRKTLNLALSHDGVHFTKIGRINGVESVGMMVPDFMHEGKYVVYYGNHALKIAYSVDFKSWEFQKDTHLTPPKHRKIIIATILVKDEGIYVFYFVRKRHDVRGRYSLNYLLFNKENPTQALWEKEKVLWRQQDEFGEMDVYPLGAVYAHGTLISYWRDSEGSIKALIHAFSFEKRLPSEPLIIEKYRHNPILTPLDSSVWESTAAFNAAAVYEAGKVHLIYRAVGATGVSMLGYAASRDGVTIDERHPHPIYIPTEPFEGGVGKPTHPGISPYVSGPGGGGGCEDPRITKIDGRYYLVYVAFDGWSPPRLAMSSISEGDFHAQNWRWTSPVLISAPNMVDKSGCILPEKIKDKYVVFHRVFPNILVDFVDNLDFDGTTFLKGDYAIGPRKYHWDSRKIGIGATPLKTPEGWLTIYNAVDDHDDSRYKIGAMLLDLQDPTKVLARSENPILEPTEHYENGGLKYGVVYPCGAVNVDGKLIVYYGGSDMVLCAATAPIHEFVTTLKKHGSPELSPAYTHGVQHVLTA